jgi:hypothetical protein
VITMMVPGWEPPAPPWPAEPGLRTGSHQPQDDPAYD